MLTADCTHRLSGDSRWHSSSVYRSCDWFDGSSEAADGGLEYLPRWPSQPARSTPVTASRDPQSMRDPEHETHTAWEAHVRALRYQCIAVYASQCIMRRNVLYVTVSVYCCLTGCVSGDEARSRVRATENTSSWHTKAAACRRAEDQVLTKYSLILSHWSCLTFSRSHSLILSHPSLPLSLTLSHPLAPTSSKPVSPCRSVQQVLTKYGSTDAIRAACDTNLMVARRLNKEGVHAYSGSRLGAGVQQDLTRNPYYWCRHTRDAVGTHMLC